MSSRTPLVLCLCLALVNTSTAQTIELPDIGDPSQQYLGPLDEYRIGLKLMRQLRDRSMVMEDVQLNEYLNAIGRRIAVGAEGAANPFTFFWVRNPDINAFALPGGFIGVNSGLLLATRSESELAGVLAHEIAHVSQHHVARAYADAQRMALPTLAAMLAGIAVAAASRNGEVGTAAVASAFAASSQRSIDLTRANEQEADRVGTQLLLRSGYNPDGMATFFARLDQGSGAAAQVPEFLRSHPLPVNRMADAQNRTANSPRPRRGDERDYRFARARMTVFANDNTVRLLRAYEENPATEGDDAELYGYVLALIRANRLDAARTQLAKLLKRQPESLPLRIEEADLALARGDADEAWRLYERLRRLYPNDFALAMRYAQALTRRGDPRRAVPVLEAQLRRRSEVPEAHELYAQATQQTGDEAATHLAMAEYYYLTGDLRAAIDQAEIGLRVPAATPDQRARLRNRLRQLQAMRDADAQDGH